MFVPAVAVGAVGVPVRAGDTRLAFKSNADCCAVDIGLFRSEVLSTLLRPTSAFTKVTTPVFPATESTAPAYDGNWDEEILPSDPSVATPLATPFSLEAIRLVLSTALTVIFAEPSNDTPLIVRAVASLVAVAALPSASPVILAGSLLFASSFRILLAVAVVTTSDDNTASVIP